MVNESPSSTADGRSTGAAYQNHLERSRTVWNRWSDYYAMSERDLEPMREAAMDDLALERGDRVLDIGCGPGVNLERLRDDVGETGTVVAVDYSPEMVAKARDRIERHGWKNVEVHLDDATTIDLEGRFDAAIATLSMSVMPDVRAAVENVHRLLVPGSPFVVFDIGGVPEGPARLANPFLRRFLRWYANWNPDGDVPGSLSAVFEESEIVDTYLVGTCYTVIARKHSPDRS
ncbi:class I SAM-dependent methyltransferase [Natrarchaeobius halalkaliphilus]|uniref:Class I SAM-dependent methyltransferase n=1 Tax=Natrarchaeobius halalkaliphilus TaxID=1679091 RepID=A0A3N6LZB2_9EURY|nr:class I SAM-dependent methyltransferase [Natrarchaeobius halalkaliphilus]RQG93254.1 class I SAM-dependent methyltransferase [Natrarchaeobius halalkaliphilus]